MTNFEKIKQMSVDDLSDFLNFITSSLAIKVCGNYIVREKDVIKQWLESEAKNE